MDHQDEPQTRGSIPRFSRLPTPRASHDNPKSIDRTVSRENHHHEAHARLAALSRPTAPSPSPLGENINRSIRSRFGWPAQFPKSRSQKPALHDISTSNQESKLETTPPSSNVDNHVYDIGDENAPTVDPTHGNENENENPKPESIIQKRQPRPSLSERTIETMSQISPSPSPSRRRSSVRHVDAPMAPPSRPASSTRTSRPNTSLSIRSSSPPKRPFRPPGASSPTKEVPPLPALPLPTSIYTPPKAFMRDKTARITKPLRERRRSESSTWTDLRHQTSPGKPVTREQSQTTKARTYYNNQTISNKSTIPQPSLSAVFKDPPKPAPLSPKIDLSSLEQNSGLMRPKSFGENPIAPSASSSSLSARSPNSLTSSISSKTEPVAEATAANTTKSSTALRETIAKAKANASKKRSAPAISPRSHSALLEEEPEKKDQSLEGNRGLLRKRIQVALTTGQLNIAAMSLTQIPDEVTKMYDMDTPSNVNWAEMVDIVKFVAADNELSELSDEIFPDWSSEELLVDDTRSNQFAGLEVLDLHSNLLQSIPLGLRRLGRLHTLKLNKNMLALDAFAIFCQIPSLKELYLANNKLTGRLPLTIGQLDRLQTLDLHGNQLEELPAEVGQLTALKRLNVSENKFLELPWKLLASLPLIEINASQNKLSGTLLPDDVERMSILQSLNVSFNKLERISNHDSFTFPDLQSLSLDGNRLSSLPDLSGYQNLLTLTAPGNLLTQIPEGFTELSQLKSADFSRNNIKIVPAEIALMDNLGLLNLASNPLINRKYLTMSTDNVKDDLRRRVAPEKSADGASIDADASSAALPGLKAARSAPAVPQPGSTPTYLYTPHNGTLDLSTHNLSSIDFSSINLSTPITTLKLSSASLNTFPVSLLSSPSIQKNLTHLDLSHNPLSARSYLNEPLDLPNLKSLNIVSTGLTSLDALTNHLRAPNLTSLNISCHRLTGHVPWLRDLAFPRLTTLLATDNWFISLDVEAVRGLEILDIRNNEIDALPPKIGMLGNLPDARVQPGKLRVFEVSGNKFRVPRISIVEKGTEAVLKDLRRMIPLNELDGEWKQTI